MWKEYSPCCLRETARASYTTGWASEFMAPRPHESPKHCQSVSAASLHLFYACSPPAVSNSGWLGTEVIVSPAACLPPWSSVTVNSSSFSLQMLPFAASFLPPYLALPCLLIMELEKQPTSVVWKFTSPWLPFVKSKSGLVREEFTPDRGLDTLMFPLQQSGLS